MPPGRDHAYARPAYLDEVLPLEALECNEPVRSLEKGQRGEEGKAAAAATAAAESRRRRRGRRSEIVGPRESRARSKIKKLERNERREASNWVKRREPSGREKEKRAYGCVRATWTPIIVVVTSSFLSSPFYHSPRLSVFRQEIEVHSSCTSAPPGID